MGKNTYDVKDYTSRTSSPTSDYVEVFPGPDGPKSIIKTAWVLPIAAQTAWTGTLDFLRTLGATVTEVDLEFSTRRTATATRGGQAGRQRARRRRG